jgi:hypothetical protein
MEWFNLCSALAAGTQDLPTLRTHPTHRPREDIFLPRQNLDFVAATADFRLLAQ